MLLYLSDNLDMRVREGRGLKGGAATSPLFFFFFLLKLNRNAAWIKGVGLKLFEVPLLLKKKKKKKGASEGATRERR